jgi:hypothetical protein
MKYLNVEIPDKNKQQHSIEFKSMSSGFKPVGYVE